jgi:hypothetical protein
MFLESRGFKMENHTMNNSKLREMKSCNYNDDKIIRNSFQANISNNQTSQHHQIHKSNRNQLSDSKNSQIHASKHNQLSDSKNAQIHVSNPDELSESKHDHVHRAKPNQTHSSKHDRLHEKALEVAATYKRSEIDLIEILQQVWVERSFYYFNCNSLFEYAVKKLHLSREVASIYNKIAKKALIIAGFKEQIQSGSISVSNANRICSVITPENKEKWFMLAQGSKLQLEKAVALASPKTAIRERAIARNIGDHVQMEIRFGTSEKSFDDLKRAQDILSQKLQRGATMDDVYSSALQLFLDKNDPLRKSCRVKTNQTQTQNQNDKIATSEIKVLGTMKSVGAARNLKITVKRAVHHKNESQCSHIDELGQRCQQRRHLHIHHIQPLSQGGTNHINNLIILCSGHHQAHHLGH